MDTSTMEKRFAEVRDRGVQDRRNRKRVAIGAAALAAAAALVAALSLAGGVFDSDDRALPDVAVPDTGVEQVETLAGGDGFPLEGKTYEVESFLAPFTITVPEKGDVPGKWHYGTGDGTSFGLNLDNSVSTGHASITLASPEKVYDPTLKQPFVGQTKLVAAPTDAAGWQRWFEQTGVAEVTSTEQLDINGVPATRLTVAVASDIPGQSFPCVPRESCLALAPEGPSLIGSASQEAFTAELTVLDVDGRSLIAVAMGAEATEDQWLPLMRSAIDSLKFS